MTLRLRGAPPPKPPIHEQEQKPPVTPIPPIAYPWYEPNQQPGYWWQLPVHLPTTPLPQLPTHEHKQEPNTSIPRPIWKMRAYVHIEPGPNPRTYEPAPNPPITYIQWWTPPSVNLPSVWPNVTLPMQTWQLLYSELFPKPTTHEGEPNQPKTPLPRLPTHEQEPREAPLPKVPTNVPPEREPNRPIGIPLKRSPRQIPLMLPPTHEPEHEPLTLPTHLPKPEGPFITYVPPTFRPMDLLQMSGVKSIVYTTPNAYQPVIPRAPPIYNVALDNNLLTL